MINLGNGWGSFLDCLRLSKDSHLHHKDENISVNFVNLDGGSDDKPSNDYRGLDLTGGETRNLIDVVAGGLATEDIRLNGASQEVTNVVDFGNAKMEGCRDDNGIYFYDGGTADTQTFMGDVQEDSGEKPTGTLLNSILPFLSEGNPKGKNAYVANSQSRAVGKTTLDLSIKPTDYSLSHYIRWTHYRGVHAYTLTLPTYFMGTCNFYDFKGLKFELLKGQMPMATVSKGFAKDGVLTIHGKTEINMDGWTPSLEISESPNIITVKTYTIQ